MQASGRNEAEIHLLRVRRQLWRKALHSPAIWGRACRVGLAVGAGQALCATAMMASRGPAAIGMAMAAPALTTVASFLAAAGTWVQGQVGKMEWWGN
jgi:hypothetical protein